MKEKFSIFVGLALLWFPLLAAELWHVDFPDAKSIERVPVWQNPDKTKVVSSYAEGAAPDSRYKGSIKFVFEQGNGIYGAESQAVFPASIPMVPGGKYRLTLNVMSPQRLQFTVQAMRNSAPWDLLGENASCQVTTEPGKWKSVTIDFVAELDAENVRLPVFLLGKLKKGATLYVSDAHLYGEGKSAELPVFSTTTVPRLSEIAKKQAWSYASAWKEQSGMREKVSLCGLWDFAPVLTEKDPIPAPSAPEWGCLLVPAHWRGGNVTNFIHTKDGRSVTAFKGVPVRELRNGWYKRTIDVPAAWQGRKVVLSFNRIDMTGDIFLNGARVGGTENFLLERECSLDVSGFLQYGKSNEITLRVGTPGDLHKERSGIAGYVYLTAVPKENFGDAVITTLVAKKQLKIDFRNPAVRNGTLKCAVRDWKTGETAFETEVAFAPSVTLNYCAPKLWSPESPNLYFLDLQLERDGRVIDSARLRFGFSELTIQGADYFLNGRKINLFADTALKSGYWSVDWHTSEEFIRRELKSLRAMNINAVYFGKDMPRELLDVYDEEGVLVLAKADIPYEEHMKHSDSEVMEIFRKEIADLHSSGRFDNHPSHVAFLIDVWYNFHPGTQNPEYIGLKQGTPRYPAFDRNGKITEKTTGDPNLEGDRGKRKARLDAIAALFKESFPEKVPMTGGSGEAGDVYATHVYHTWGAPWEEMRAFFRRYSLLRERPIFVGEHNIPYPGSLCDIFNWHGRGNPLAMENFARYAGNDGYFWRTIYTDRPLHAYGPESLHDSRTDRDSDGAYHICSDMYSFLLSRSLETLIPGWRYSGANGIGFFGYVLSDHFTLAGHSVPGYRNVPNELSKPAFYPEYLPGGAGPIAFPVYENAFFLKPTLSYAAFLRVSSPVLAEFLEDAEDEYGLDHAYWAGELLKKKLWVVNDSALDQTFECTVSLRNERNGVLAAKRFRLALKSGERKSVPVQFALPGTANRINGFLQAEIRNAAQKPVFARLPIEIFPQPPQLALSHELSLCDPEGSVKAYLQKRKIPFRELKTLDNPPKSGVLIVGRAALSLTPTVPDFNAMAAGGVNVLILEQAISSSLELMTTRTRHAFLNAAGHPALQGFEDRDFANWRGGVSLADSYENRPAQIRWSAAGNRNMLASYVFRRPPHGNFLSLLACGFDLYQTPLLEFRGRNGSWIGSQLELAPRLGTDPVATTLFHRLVSYLDNRGMQTGKTLFCGGAAGEKLLKSLRVEFLPVAELNEQTLAGADTLLISDPDFKKLKHASMDLAAFVYNGGKVVYLQTGKAFESVWLPFPLKLEEVKSRSALPRPGKPDDFWRCGWDSNDLYWHDLFSVPAFTEIPEQANAFSPGVVVDLPHGAGRFVLVSVEPETFRNAPATGKTCRFLSALLTNAGVEIRNESSAYSLKTGSEDVSLNLADYKWSFALDPQKKGLREKVETGRKGSLFWQNGLIADGAEVEIGIPFEHFLRKEYDGVVWYRLELTLPDALRKAEKLYLSFGRIDDFDEAFFNGVKVGSTDRTTPTWWMRPRLYVIPGKLLKPGKNILVMRVEDEKGEGGIMGLPATLSNRPHTSGGRGWITPFPEGSKRDYDYNPDPVRQY